MIHFRSKAGAEVLMLQAHAEAVLQALGREPAPQGIFLPEQVDAALAAFALAQQAPADEAEVADEEPSPDLGRRAWPLLELLRSARQKAVPVTWSSS
jgi:hypothetical protein